MDHTRLYILLLNYTIGIPPPAGMGGSGFGSSATHASVVRNIDATLEAFCNALLTTFVGSTIPALNISCLLYTSSPEISEFYYVTGQHSLLIKAYVSDTEHLAQLLEKTQKFGITETSVVMYENIKNTL